MARSIIALLVLVLASLNCIATSVSPIRCSESQVNDFQNHICRACDSFESIASSQSPWCNWCLSYFEPYTDHISDAYPKKLTLLCEPKCQKLRRACYNANLLADSEGRDAVGYVWLGQTIVGYCPSAFRKLKPVRVTAPIQQALAVLHDAHSWARSELIREVKERQKAECEVRETLEAGNGDRERQGGKEIGKESDLGSVAGDDVTPTCLATEE